MLQLLSQFFDEAPVFQWNWAQSFLQHLKLLLPSLPAGDVLAPQVLSSEPLPNENLSVALDQKIVSPNRIVADSGSYARIVVGFPDLVVGTGQERVKLKVVVVYYGHLCSIPIPD